MKNKYWLFIEPYISITLNNNTLLLYNTLDSKILIFNTKMVLNLFVKMNNDKNLYVIELCDDDLIIPEINSFIHSLKNNYFGDIMIMEETKRKPIQVSPFVKILHDPIRFRDNLFKSGEFIMYMLSEISIYLNNNIKSKNPIFTLGCKQFDFPSALGEPNSMLDFSIIESFLKEVKNSSLYKLNILGGNIFEYYELKRLIDLLSNCKYNVSFHFCYYEILSNKEILKLLTKNNIEIIINYYSPLDLIKSEVMVDKINVLLPSAKSNFIVQNNYEVEYSYSMIKKNKIRNYAIIPFFNNNEDFFGKSVYMNKEDIINSKPSVKNIQAREKINEEHFGKLYFLSDGNGYSNLNYPCIGSLYNESIYAMLSKDITGSQSSWFKKRNEVEPCSNCIYHKLCPSISNYEFAIGKNNLCHIQ